MPFSGLVSFSGSRGDVVVNLPFGILMLEEFPILPGSSNVRKPDHRP